jgi:hypothetical protein
VPEGFVPMKFPWTRFPLASWTRPPIGGEMATPTWLLPEMTLQAPVQGPPGVVDVAPPIVFLPART